MNYTLHQLQIFLKITETKSITKAAEELFLTQPAVSIQLKNFQDQFDIPLTEVIGRKLHITEFGTEIGKIAKNIIDEVKNIDYKTNSFKGLLTGELKISVVSTGKYIIPYFLTDFINAHHGIDLKLDVTNKSKVLKNLENNEIDFALVSTIPENFEIEKIELMKNKLYLVGPHNESIKLKKNSIIDDNNIIFREKGSATRIAMENYFSKNEITIKKKLELTSNEAIKQALIAKLGYSIMPLIGIRNEIQNNILDIIPTNGLPIISNWNIIWLKQKKMTPISQAYIDFLKQEKEHIIQKSFKWYNEF